MTDVWIGGMVFYLQARDPPSRIWLLSRPDFRNLDPNTTQALWAIVGTSCGDESGYSVALVRPAVITTCPKLVNPSC